MTVEPGGNDAVFCSTTVHTVPGVMPEIVGRSATAAAIVERHQHVLMDAVVAVDERPRHGCGVALPNIPRAAQQTTARARGLGRVTGSVGHRLLRR